MGKKFMWVDSGKAERELGYTHGAAREALERAARWFVEKGYAPAYEAMCPTRMSADPVEFGFVAALEREVSGLVRGWSVTRTRARSRIAIGGRIAYLSYAGCCPDLRGTGVERAYAAAKSTH